MTTLDLDLVDLDPDPVLSFTPDSALSTAFLQAACAASERRLTGVIYLLHFDKPYRHARHYCGFATNLPARLAIHEAGRGARLLVVAKAHGITWTLARTWPGTRRTERALKKQGGAARRCPLCGTKPRTPLGGTP